MIDFIIVGDHFPTKIKDVRYHYNEVPYTTSTQCNAARQTLINELEVKAAQEIAEAERLEKEAEDARLAGDES